MRAFQIYENYMLPTIPVIFEINILCGLFISILNHDFVFKFPYNFCGDFRLPVIHAKFICMLRGSPCNAGIFSTFYRGTICSVQSLSTLTCLINVHACLVNSILLRACMFIMHKNDGISMRN